MAVLTAISTALPTTLRRARWAAWAVLGLAGCDEPLADATYQGVPIETFVAQRIDNEPHGELRVAVFWSPDSVNPQSFDELVEQTSTSQRSRPGESYVLHFFAEPDEGFLAEYPPGDPNAEVVGVGRVLAYEDGNDNGVHDDGESFVGMMTPSAILFVPNGLPASIGPNRLDLEPGFHMVPVPLVCIDAEPIGSGDCGVPVGAPCGADDDCGEGYCITSFIVDWPGGYCAIRHAPDLECLPADVAPISAPPEVGSLYVEACESDAECRDKQTYGCEPAAGACMPLEHPELQIGRVALPPLCVAPGRRAVPGMMPPNATPSTDGGTPPSRDGGMLPLRPMRPLPM